MTWWIKTCTMLAFLWAVYVLEPGAGWKQISLIPVTFIPYVLCVLQGYREGAELDRRMGR